MYQILTFCHNFMRWLVLASLLIAIFQACRGYFFKGVFSRTDNAIRHWTATIAHIQLMIGMVLYFQSPLIKYFLNDFKKAMDTFDLLFFGLIHGLLMLTAVVLITIGSARSKRRTMDRDKFRTMLTWFAVAFIIIFIAIPWPFSPLANRPYYR